jgi:hypothetical protein
MTRRIRGRSGNERFELIKRLVEVCAYLLKPETLEDFHYALALGLCTAPRLSPVAA